MIVLYTILQDNNTLQSYTHPNRSADEYSQIVKQTLRHSKDNGSKIINVLNVGPYFVYYFKQDSFTFILACFSNKRSNKMHNYLRIVADIFYESYEEGKFADKLVKVMVILMSFRRKSIAFRRKRKKKQFLRMKKTLWLRGPIYWNKKIG